MDISAIEPDYLAANVVYTLFKNIYRGITKKENRIVHSDDVLREKYFLYKEHNIKNEFVHAFSVGRGEFPNTDLDGIRCILYYIAHYITLYGESYVQEVLQEMGWGYSNLSTHIREALCLGLLEDCDNIEWHIKKILYRTDSIVSFNLIPNGHYTWSRMELYQNCMACVNDKIMGLSIQDEDDENIVYYSYPRLYIPDPFRDKKVEVYVQWSFSAKL